MIYQLTLSISENSPQDQNIESVARSEQISREEAALRLLAAAGLSKPSNASPEARRILGAFSAPEEAALMDEVMEIVNQDRERQKAELPCDL